MVLVFSFSVWTISVSSGLLATTSTLPRVEGRQPGRQRRAGGDARTFLPDW